MKDVPVVSVRQMRECDEATIKKLGDSRILMYRAGEAVVEEMEKEGILDRICTGKLSQNQTCRSDDSLRKIPDNGEKAQVAIVCGSGNNAGDGYVIAEILHQKGIGVTLLLMEDKFSADGGYYFERCRDLGVPYRFLQGENDGSLHFTNSAVIVDCIYGTGFRGRLNRDALHVIREINRSDSFVVSVDINSGMNGDSGVQELCVHSDLTVSIGFFKTAHRMEDCKRFMKKLVNANIGIMNVV